MEGDGEGMVAIFQGLNDAGVTLTVLNRPRQDTERRRSPKPRIHISTRPTVPAVPTIPAIPAMQTVPAMQKVPVMQTVPAMQTPSAPTTPQPPQAQRSTVETSTDYVARATTGVQICDGRYASSYKLAHCRMTPTSPPERVSEFPPQRKEPNRNQGNFEVGGSGSGQVRAMSARATRHYGGSPTWGDRDSVYGGKSNRGNEEFVHSLRKYPSMSPVQTVSSDLIEKLIKYTQSKNSSPRSSRPTKSMRSLHKDQSLDTSDITKVSKHQQTYTRRQNSDDGPSPVGRPTYRRTRNFKLYSPVSDTRNLKYRESQFNTSYDYLKAGSSYLRSDHPERSERPVRSERPTRSERPIRAERPTRSFRDVRLNDVSRYIRSTIREIYNERPVVLQVCPKLKNRYNQHKKNCPVRNTESMLNEEDEQASVPMLSRILASISGCAMPSSTSKRDDITCYCTKASQCGCKPDASTNTPRVDFQPIIEPQSSKHCHCCPNTIDRSSQNPPKCDCKQVEAKLPPQVCRCSPEDQAYYNKRIDEEISDWLKDVPVQSIESSNNKSKRQKMISDLERKLKKLTDDENFDDNAKEIINNFITDFPIWYPVKDKKDKKLFKQDLADKLLEKILDIPRKPDRFKDAVKTWIRDIDFEDVAEDLNMEDTINNITNTLKSLAAERPECDHFYSKIIRKEIIKILEKLPISIEGNRDTVLKRIANKLVVLIVNIPRNVDLSEDRTDLKDEIEQTITDWLTELSSLRDNMKELKRDPKLIEALAKKLNKLQSQGMDDETISRKMREEIRKFMEDIDVALETLDELIEDLMSQLENTIKENEMEILDDDELAEDVIDWLRGIPGISELQPRKFKKLARELTSKIREAKQQGIEDYQNDIIECFIDADVSLEPDILATHIEELMALLQLWPSKRQYKENVKGKMQKDIDDIINASPIEKDKQRDLKSILGDIVTKNLDDSLLDSEKTQEDVKEMLLDDIDNVIDDTNITDESKNDVKMQINEVLGKHFDRTLSKLRKDRGDIKQKIEKDVKSAVKDLPIDKKRKKDVMDQVRHTLDKNINKPLSDEIEDTIKKGINDIIEESPIAEDEELMSYLKNKLSDAASKVINIFTPKHKNIGDIKSKVAHDVNEIIEESTLSSDEKEDLKQKVEEILSEYEAQRLSERGNEIVKEKILEKFDVLPIQDRRNELKSKVSATVTKDFDDALFILRKDMNKIKSKIVKDFDSAIDKSPIDREQKKHFNSKLKGMLAKTFHTSLSDDQKKSIIDDISNIVADVTPGGESTGLRNKLTETLTKVPTQRKFTEDLKDTIEDELNDIIDDAPLSQHKKNDLRKLLQDRLENSLGGPLSDIKNKIKQELYDQIENSSIQEDAKTDFKIKMMKVLAENLDVQATEKLKVDDYKKTITKDVNRVIDKLPVDLGEKKKIKSQIENMLANTLYKPVSDEVKENIEDDIFYIIDNLNLPKDQLSEIKSKLSDILADTFETLQNQGMDIGFIKEVIIQDISRFINELQIARAKKNYIIQRVKDALAENLDENMSNEVQKTIKQEFSNILDNSSIPEKEKSGLKEKFTNIVGKNMVILPTEEEKYEEKIDIKNEISNDMDEFIDSFEMDADEKEAMKNDVRFILNEVLYKPLSEELGQSMKKDIFNVIEAMKIPNDKKTRLKSQINKVLTDDLDSLINQNKGADEIKNIITDSIGKIIERAPISREKKNLLKKKMTGALIKNMGQPFSDDVKKSIKDKLNSRVDDSKITKEKQVEFKKLMSNIVSKNFKKLQPEKVVSKVRENTVNNLLEEMQKSIEASPIPEEKKRELRNKLKKMAIENLNKPLSDNVQDTIKKELSNLLGELSLTKVEENKLKIELTNSLDEAIETIRGEEKETTIQKEKKLLNKRLKRQTEIEESKMKTKILEGLERTIEESSISQEKKIELRKKLQSMATTNLHKPMSDDVQAALKEGINNILDELPISKDEKKKLQRNLTHIVDENVESFQDNMKLQDMETRTKEKILQDIEKSIDDSPITNEKKIELKRKLKDRVAESLDQPFTDEIQAALKDGINEILDELPIPKDKKTQLKNQLTKIVDTNVGSLRNDIKHTEADQLKKIETRAQNNIVREIEQTIEDAPIPQEKKKELKKKLKDLATKNFKQPFTAEVQKAFKDGINDIMDELPLQKDQKNKLKNELTGILDENVSTLHDEIKAKEDLKIKRHILPQAEVQTATAKANILQGIEKIIAKSSIPEEKKQELRKKIQSMAAENLNKPLTDATQKALQDEIGNILDELPVSQDEKKKLKKGLTNIVDQNLEFLRDDIKQTELESRTKDNILRGIEKSIEDSPIPIEKKIELKKKLNDMAAKTFRKPLTNEVQGALRDGIDDILDNLPIPNEQKNKLKTELLGMIDNTFKSLREEMKQKDAEQLKHMETRTQDNILRGLEKSIEDAPISQEKKLELKQKLKDMAAANFNQPFTEKVQAALKHDIDEMLNELPLPKEQKDKLKEEMTDIVDENASTLRDNIKAKEDFKLIRPRADAAESKMKENVMQGIEKTIAEAHIPEDKKQELRNKLQKLAAENFDKPMSDAVQAAIKDGISNILDELPVSQEEKYKLKKGLTHIVDKNVESLEDDRKQKEIETRTRDNILRGIQKSIEDAPISQEKKTELKKRLKDMAAKNFDKPFTDDVQGALRDGINDLLDELNLPKEQKDKLKTELTDMVDTNIKSLKDDVKQEQINKMETRTQDNILQGLENSIKEAPISQEKKLELKQKLKDMAANNFNQPFTDEVQAALKHDIDEILDELPLPKDQKTKLKAEMTDIVDENVSILRDDVKAKEDLNSRRRSVPQSEVAESKMKENITQGIEKTIEAAQIPEEKKQELRKKIQKLTAENFDKPMSDAVQAAIKDGISNILDELPVSQEEKNKLSKGFTNVVDKNVESLKEERQKEKDVAQLHKLETRAQDNILRGIEKSIDDSQIPQEKKNEIKQKLMDMAAKNFNKPLTHDVQGELSDGINDILDGLPILSEQKNKLKTELLGMIDNTFKSLREEMKQKEAEQLQNMETRTQDNILRGLENSIEYAPISQEKKLELKQKLKDMAAANFNQPFTEKVQAALKHVIDEILDELPLPKEQKDKLKTEMTDIVDENASTLRDNIKAKEDFKLIRPRSDAAESKMKENVMQGIEKTIAEAHIPEEKKQELRKKLHKLAAENFDQPMSDAVQAAIKDGISNILDELPVSQEEKSKLKKALTNVVDKNVESLEDDRKQKEIEIRTQDNILRGIEKSIDNAPILQEKKTELKKKLKDMAAKNFDQPFTVEVQGALTNDINDILDELPLPKEQKDKLKTELIDMVDTNIKSFKDDVKQKDAEQIKKIETRTQDNTLQELEKSIEEAPISQEKKLELKQKLKDMAAKNFNQPFTDEVQAALKHDIDEILDELPLPKEQKDKFKTEMTNIVDENTLRDNIKEKEDLKLRRRSVPRFEVAESKMKENIMQGIEKTIEEAQIPEEKKKELRKKLQKMAAENFDKPMSDAVQAAIKNGISNILDELPVSQEAKNKLKKAFIIVVDKNVETLKEDRLKEQDVTQLHKLETRAQDNILRGIEKSIDDSQIPQEKKDEIKQKLMDMAAKNFNKPLTDDIQSAYRDGINDILDELPIPEQEKNKLKSELIDVIGKTFKSLRDDLKQKENEKLQVMEKNTQENIIRGFEVSIEASPVSQDKKIELNNKFKDMVKKNFSQPYFEGLQGTLKDGVHTFLKESTFPKEEKQKLENELDGIVDTNIEYLKDKIKERNAKQVEILQNCTKDKIFRGIEKSVEDAPISNDQRLELRKKLKDMASENFNQPFSVDLQNALTRGINNILEELALPKGVKNKLKRELTDMVHTNIKALQDDIIKAKETPRIEVDESKTKESILKGIEKTIQESSIPEDKKQELRNKLHSMAAENFNKPLTDDVLQALKGGIYSIINELPVSEDEKNKLKKCLTNVVDKNVESLRDERDIKTEVKEMLKMETHAQNDILQGFAKSVKNSPIPKEKKIELKKKLKDMAIKYFKQPYSDKTRTALKDGINDILNEIDVPLDQKKNLKKELTGIVDKNIQSLQDNLEQSDAKHLGKLENRVRDKILQGIEKFIDDTKIPEEKKLELMQKLKDMADENFKLPLSVDAENALKVGIDKILDELPLPEDEKRILKKELTSVVDENMSNLRDNIKAKETLKANRKSIPDPKTRMSLSPKLEVDKSLKEEIEDVLIKQQIDPSYIPKLEANIVGELQDLVVNAGDIDSVKRNVTKKIMQDTNLSEEEANNLSSKLIDRAREMALVAKANDSDLYNKERMSQYDILKRRVTELSPKEFMTSPEQLQIKDTLIYTIDGVPYDISNDDAINEVLEEKLASQVSDIDKPLIIKKEMKATMGKAISDVIDHSSIPKTVKSSLKCKLTNKIEQDIDKSQLTQKKDFDDIKREMLKDVKNITDASSIPADKKKKLKFQLGEALDKEFQEHRDWVDETLPSAPKSDKHFVPAKASTPKKPGKAKDKGTPVALEKAQKEYTDKLTNVIKNWLDNMPIELDRKLKAELLKDLTNDVVDRHKYLRVHPEAKTSDQEELENLKYQVFRRLSKKVPAQDTGAIMRGTQELLKKIANIEVPASLPQWKRTTGQVTLKYGNIYVFQNYVALQYQNNPENLIKHKEKLNIRRC